MSSWVDVVGPWTGSVVLTTGRQTAADLTRALLGETAPELLEHEDVADAFGEIANVVGGNVKAALPGPSGLSLPDVGRPPRRSATPPTSAAWTSCGVASRSPSPCRAPCRRCRSHHRTTRAPLPPENGASL